MRGNKPQFKLIEQYSKTMECAFRVHYMRKIASVKYFTVCIMNYYIINYLAWVASVLLGSNIITKLMSECYEITTKSSADPRLKLRNINCLINDALCNSQSTCLEIEEDEEVKDSFSYEVKVENCKILDFKVSNARMRKVAHRFEDFVEVCFSNLFSSDIDIEERKKQYKSLFRLFLNTTKMLRKDDDFSDPEINDVQLSMDQFFKLFIQMFGPASVTNYIHLWGSGDLRYYLNKYRNLHRHSTISLECTVGFMRRSS